MRTIILRKIYQELVAIRKELQAIRNSEKPFSEKEFQAYINHLLTEDCFQPRIIDGEKVNESACVDEGFAI